MQIKYINEEIVQRVSLETGISLDTVREVTNYQGQYTEKIISEGNFEGVMWPYIGKIMAPPKKVQSKANSAGKIKGRTRPTNDQAI